MTSGGPTARSRAHHFGPTRLADHFVYRCYDADGDLLYIGCTSNVAKRMADHRRGGRAASRWLAIFMTRYEVTGPYRGRDEARKAEAEAIAVEQPIFNRQERGVAGWRPKGEVARYLVERGHRDLAIETCCGCWRETRELGAYDSWCVAHEDHLPKYGDLEQVSA